MFNSEHLAGKFYSHVRCKLCHEARTDDGWIILKNYESEGYGGNKIPIDVEKKVVYRDELQNSFDEFIEWYKAELVENSNKELQVAFIRKLNFLFDLPYDHK